LRYLSRYTHRTAISNRRLVAADENGVAFKYKDYRLDGPARYKTMTLATDEFISPVFSTGSGNRQFLTSGDKKRESKQGLTNSKRL
jgi:hypothetical protein